MANKRKRPEAKGRAHAQNKNTKQKPKEISKKHAPEHPKRKKKLTPQQRRRRKLKKRMRLVALLLFMFLVIFFGFKTITNLTKNNDETISGNSNHEISSTISTPENKEDVLVDDSTLSDNSNSNSNSNAEHSAQEEQKTQEEDKDGITLPEDNFDNARSDVVLNGGENTESTAQPTPEPTPEATPEPEVKRIIGTLPESNEFCTLVNADNALGKDYKPKTGIVSGTQKPFDARAIADFEDMLNAASDAGYPMYVVSTYRSISYQDGLFQKKVNEFLAKNNNRPKAEEEAAKWVAPPGTSEHNLGLAADIVSAGWYVDHGDLEQSFENTEHFKWLYENCSDYGFILRYPKGAEEITGISYEPWHYRYVGKEIATFIMNNELTLEEYLDML